MSVAIEQFEQRAREIAVIDALREVIDPELGMNIVELALLRQIEFAGDGAEIKMVLTTPFCPYAGALVAQVKAAVESVVDGEVVVRLLAERWDPRDAGLEW